jgi:cell cycle arrest protein BUB2
MNSASPMKVLRQFPQLQARKVIGVTVALIKDIPEDLYTELVAHTATPEMRR